MEFAYGVLAYVKDYLRVKSSDSLEDAKNHRTKGFGNLLKNVLSVSRKE